MQTVQFNYELWKNHPQRDSLHLVTRDGEIITEFTDYFVGKIEDRQQVFGVHDSEVVSWDLNGNFLRIGEISNLDLFILIPYDSIPDMYVPVFEVPADIYGRGESTKVLLASHCETKEQADKVGNALDVEPWKFIGTYKLVKQ